MYPQLRKQGLENTKPADLSVFPLDRDAVQRLARVLNSEELHQTRLKTASAIVAMLEPVFSDIEKMEALASKLIPARPDLVNDIRTVRKDAEHLRQVARESFGGTSAGIERDPDH